MIDDIPWLLGYVDNHWDAGKENVEDPERRRWNQEEVDCLSDSCGLSITPISYLHPDELSRSG